MRKYIFFNPREPRTFMYPNGEIADTARILADYPAAAIFPFILLTDESEQVCGAVENFAAMRSHLNIPSDYSDEQALQEMTELENASPPPTDDTPTPDERIAAALEMQNLMAIPDVAETEEPVADAMTINPEIVRRNFRRGLWGARQVEMCRRKGLMTDKQVEGILYAPDEQEPNLSRRARYGRST